MHPGLSATPIVGENKPLSPHSLSHFSTADMYDNDADIDVTFRYSGYFCEAANQSASHDLIICKADCIESSTLSYDGEEPRKN